MTAPVIWLAFYLSAGALVLWACYHTSACRLQLRLERNRRMASGIVSAPGSGPTRGPDVIAGGAPATR
ncbi:hypothetical protein BH23ACT12_BH23ACT12_23190 [soil metagenome]